MVMKILVAIVLAIIGLSFAGVGLMSILDPVGAQAANDANPLAVPQLSWFSYAITIFGLGLYVLSMNIGFKSVS